MNKKQEFKRRDEELNQAFYLTELSFKVMRIIGIVLAVGVFIAFVALLIDGTPAAWIVLFSGAVFVALYYFFIWLGEKFAYLKYNYYADVQDIRNFFYSEEIESTTPPKKTTSKPITTSTPTKKPTTSGWKCAKCGFQNPDNTIICKNCASYK